MNTINKHTHVTLFQTEGLNNLGVVHSFLMHHSEQVQLSAGAGSDSPAGVSSLLWLFYVIFPAIYGYKISFLNVPWILNSRHAIQYISKS